MRHLLPRTKVFLTQSGQTVALLGVAVLAMAAAPHGGSTDETGADFAPTSILDAPPAPVAAPLPAVVEAVPPLTRRIVFQSPLEDRAINSRFGMRTVMRVRRMHQGVDIAAPSGTPVMAAAEGEVVRAGFNRGGYGNFIEVRHPNGMTSFYAHLSRIDVSAGDHVDQGERIGRVGSTGRSTGPHLHFEVRRAGDQVNPERVLGQSYEIAATTPDSI